eukprot:CAMPEP_0181116178 /NCGR_PEP_ID=MMETSP1071-20121207/21813_1 /TAXON_ID=35127 /ORGANISM="Thalassiosira sp., Strain NH16" /LENGTH=334 /DNA_ID=CAMNT_0023200407 /DNA_START=48 /DNA_END=1052 /DNA_ORIENTATION=-
MGETTDRGKFSNMFKKDDGGAKPDAADGNGDDAGKASNLAFGFTDKQAKYIDVPWSNLPLSARKANKVLGHDRDSWDARKVLPIYSKSWADLDESARTACETLGWDEASWDDQYHGTEWAKLPSHVQRAAGTLGWTGGTWDYDSRANVVLTKKWGKLTDEERRLLNVMGNHAHNWDAASKARPSAPGPKAEPAAANNKKLFGFTDREAHYEDVPWSRLPLAQRKAAKTLGYTPDSWDAQEWCDDTDVHWWDLEGEVKDACDTLGWTEKSWTKYEGYYWEDLPEHAQRAATKMGWDREKWDDDWDVDCWHKGWESFSDEEKRCLHVMGWYRLKWD